MNPILESRIRHWKRIRDEAERLRQDDHKLTPPDRDLLLEDVQHCDRRIRELEHQADLVSIQAEIEDFKATRLQ